MTIIFKFILKRQIYAFFLPRLLLAEILYSKCFTALVVNQSSGTSSETIGDEIMYLCV